MSYNYGREVRRLQNRQAQEDAELREAGVSEVFIEILHKMNWRDLKADRVFYTHNVQSIDDIFINPDLHTGHKNIAFTGQ